MMPKHLLTWLIALTICVPGLSQAQAPDRLTPPVPGPAPSLKLPAIQKRTLSNGMPVWIVESHEVPVADIMLIVRSGASADPAGKFGLAHFTAALLDEGAGNRSALELADAIDFLGASLTTSSSFDASTITLHTLTTKIDDALPLLGDVARRPTFADAEFQRMRQERTTGLLQTRDNAGAVASAAFSRVLYGATHRYGTPVIGGETSNAAITLADIKSFYATQYRPQNAHLIVVGDVTASTLLPRLERTFGDWKSAGPVAAVVPATVPRATARAVYLIDKPGAAQSQIRIGTIGVARSTPDYFVLDVMNTILGGSFGSRLNQNLREEHGYTYGASSFFTMRRAPGPFLSGAGVQTDKTAESLQEFFKEFTGMRTPVPEDELTRARNLEALGFPGGFETTGEIASQLAELVIYGLPETFLSDYVPKIEAVTAADVERAAGVYLPADVFAVVVVGDLAQIEAPVRALNLGPVTTLTLDDVLK